MDEEAKFVAEMWAFEHCWRTQYRALFLTDEDWRRAYNEAAAEFYGAADQTVDEVQR